MKKKLWVGILIGLIFGVLLLPLTAMGQQVVTFPDRNLEKVVRGAIGKSTGPIRAADLEKLTKLDASWESITDLTGLEYCTNLEVLGLELNQISDISALSKLTNLKELELWSNQISDISALSKLTNLEWLNLKHNQISDISALSKLTNLEWLNLKHNQISDISALSRLTNLWGLWLERNQISDIKPLVSNSGLSEGDWVYLEGNPLSSTSTNVYIPQLKKRGVFVVLERIGI
jgi:Leucine-rich repeat (LRR) protein